MKSSTLKKQFVLSCLIIALSCSTSDRSTGREVKKETRDKRKSPIVLAAKQENFYFNLRENNYFDYYGMTLGVAKAELYAGMYELKGDSLSMAFHNNHKPEDLTGTGFIDRARNQVVLLSKDTAHNRRLEIILAGK